MAEAKPFLPGSARRPGRSFGSPFVIGCSVSSDCGAIRATPRLPSVGHSRGHTDRSSRHDRLSFYDTPRAGAPRRRTSGPFEEMVARRCSSHSFAAAHRRPGGGSGSCFSRGTEPCRRARRCEPFASARTDHVRVPGADRRASRKGGRRSDGGRRAEHARSWQAGRRCSAAVPPVGVDTWERYDRAMRRSIPFLLIAACSRAPSESPTPSTLSASQTQIASRPNRSAEPSASVAARDAPAAPERSAAASAPSPQADAGTPNQASCKTVADCWLDDDGNAIARPKSQRGRPLPKGNCGENLLWLRNVLECQQGFCASKHIGDMC
jgi:hypothetical protein